MFTLLMLDEIKISFSYISNFQKDSKWLNVKEKQILIKTLGKNSSKTSEESIAKTLFHYL